MSAFLSIAFGIMCAVAGIYLGVVKLEYAFASLFVIVSAILLVLAFFGVKGK